MDEILVATLNLHNRRHRWPDRRELIVSELLDSRPDVVSLQEIFVPLGQAKWLRNQINSRISGKSYEPYTLVQRRRKHPFRGYTEGVGILSQMPILAYDAISLGAGGKIAVRANIELPSQRTFDFIAVQLQQGSDAKQTRLEQTMRLVGWIQTHNPAPIQIIAGDLNESPGGIAIEYLRQHFRSVFVEDRGYDPVATFPTLLVERQDGWSGCLDYIFASKEAGEVVSAQIFCKKPSANDPALYPSDHVGLLARLQVMS